MGNLIEGLSQKIGQAQWDLARHSHQVPKPGHVWPPWSNQDDSPAQVVF